MPCKHLHELIEMCERNHLKLSSSDLIRMVCPSCGVEEECPSTLYDEYDATHPQAEEPAGDSGVEEP
ncbi:MAG: hypothetical protein GXX96_29010 [Planctomycetaceae bacterium]|nr:hypothetical protein [Planctomycetaceae bacterium]